MAGSEGPHLSLLHHLPGYPALEAALGRSLGQPYLGEVSPGQPVGVTHVIMAGLVVVVVTGLLLRSGYHKLEAEGRIVPEERLTLRTFFELLMEVVLSTMRDVIGPKHADRFLPLIGTLAVFILFSNLAGLIPGFSSPTSNLNTTAACAVVVFLVTHYWGFRIHGIKYVKHFMGPVIWLAPLMIPIELVSHLARPLSLSLRLFGNMFGDHMVLGFFLLIPLFVPLPMMVLGLLIAVVQTMVFCMLTMVYIGQAVSEAH
ncbi:MAG: F0F1 ATP synthase subunit A [Myxococcota bacterium]|jgi:F-type H+-transporting ATPase subunit a|nr:F0F1 ATP synthase subunit A [Myxococcota bacterium]